MIIMTTPQDPSADAAYQLPVPPAIIEAAQAAAFRRLLQHLQAQPTIQNIDLMNLAGFCRNCLSKWLAAALATQGYPVPEAQVRNFLYQMAYEDWKRLHQRPLSQEPTPTL
jgi:uncharacterized protein